MYDLKASRAVMAAVVERAICDVYNWEVKGIHRHSREHAYTTAVSYLSSANSSRHLQFLGINMTGTDVLSRIRSHNIVPVNYYGVE